MLSPKNTIVCAGLVTARLLLSVLVMSYAQEDTTDGPIRHIFEH
jgi:hypothetical protein